MLHQAHFDTKGGKQTFAALCTEACNADLAVIAIYVVNGCFSNTAPAAKTTKGGLRTFAAIAN